MHNIQQDGYFTSSAGEAWFHSFGGMEETTIPLVLIHGGPGFSSYYLEPVMRLADRIPVVRYDQAGCGKARRNGPRRLFTVDGFVEELEALRESLNVSSMHLLGHSFGGLVAAEYVLKFRTV